jgi:hypothetical protein
MTAMEKKARTWRFAAGKRRRGVRARLMDSGTEEAIVIGLRV